MKILHRYCVQCTIQYITLYLYNDCLRYLLMHDTACFSDSRYTVLFSFFLVDQIYHLASPASPPHYMYNPIKV